MSRIVWLVCACGLALTTAPAFAEDRKPDGAKPAPAPAKRADPAEKILGVLATGYTLREGANINEIPLFELLQDLNKRYGVTVVINEQSFKAAGIPNVREEKPTIATTTIGDVTVHQFLTTILEGLGATYLIKNGAIEIVTVDYAVSVTKARADRQDESRPQLKEPLVSVIVKEKPLNEVVAKIAEVYDLTVIVAPQAGDAKTGFVTARLLNLPADKAIELIALQCDLRVVRRGTAFLITSKDQANELFNEKLDKERQQIEIQKLREAPAKPPEKAPAPPEKPAAFGPFMGDFGFTIPKGVPGLFGPAPNK